MMLSCGALLALSVSLKLPCVPAAQETYFLPLDEVRADAATLALTGPDGAAVPFSFDARVDVPKNAPGLKRHFDGWTSHYNFPIEGNACWRLGWLSFKAPAGVREVTLSFETGEGPTGERQNPAVRTWWVNLFKREPVADPAQGLKVVVRHLVPQSDFVDISGAAGRRLVTLIRMLAPEGTPDQACFSTCLPNAAKATVNANAGYFSVPTNGCDMLSEGFVKAGGPVTFTDRKGGSAATLWASCKSKPDMRPLIVKDWRIQSAPHVVIDKPRLVSDLFNVGDLVEIILPKSRGEVLVPFEAEGIRGERVVTLAPKAVIDVSAELCDKKGAVVRTACGTSFPLTGIKPGRYNLIVSLSSGGVRLCRAPIAIDVQASPW